MLMFHTLRNLPRAKALRLAALLVAAGAIYACSFGKPDITTVPDQPSFFVDVLPVLSEHCLLCHGYPAKRGAPSSFRLDVYDDTDGVRGAHSEAKRFIDSVQSDSMPPAAHWGDGVGPNGKKLLLNWQADGYLP
jgi:uncharacterized membrane protein